MAYIELSEDNFFSNLTYFKSRVGLDKICIVLKDNAYGHGISQVALLASAHGVRHCCVKNEIEASQILSFGFQTILVLYPQNYLLKHRSVIYAVNCLSVLNEIPKGSRLELKIDTGMNRNGLKFDDETLSTIKEVQKSYLLNGFFTHFGSADIKSCSFLQSQLNQFMKFKRILVQAGFTQQRYHCSNTSATIVLGDIGCDLYRVGIGLYGYNPTIDNCHILRPVLSVYGQKISTRVIHRGDRVGYGKSGFVAPKVMTISNYDVGYATIPRINENEVYYTCSGNKVLGAVSMDSLSLESTNELELIYQNATSLATLKNTIVYEILTRLTHNIPRIINKKTQNVK